MATQITTALQPLNPFPHRLAVSEDEMVIQGETFFDQLQQDFQPELSDIIDEMNAVATEVNTNAINTENNAILANGLANFQGAWSGTTPYAKGQSVESTAGSKIYYTSKLDGNLNNIVTNTTYWLPNPINDKLDKDTSVLAAKTSLVDADVVLMGDSAASNIAKKITWANFKTAIGTALGSIISSLTAKTTPVDADGFIINDSASSNASKFLSLSNLKATIFASPSLTGNPTATTQTAQNNSTRIATTAYVDGKFVRGTVVATTSGTAIDFTGIPSWVKRINVMFNGVSTNGTSLLVCRIGSGSIESTGYLSFGSVQASTISNVISNTSHFILTTNMDSTSPSQGVITLINQYENYWLEDSITSSRNDTIAKSIGSKNLSGTLDRIRITTVNGTDTFDAGSMNIMYEG